MSAVTLLRFDNSLDFYNRYYLVMNYCELIMWVNWSLAESLHVSVTVAAVCHSHFVLMLLCRSVGPRAVPRVSRCQHFIHHANVASYCCCFRFRSHRFAFERQVFIGVLYKNAVSESISIYNVSGRKKGEQDRV